MNLNKIKYNKIKSLISIIVKREETEENVRIFSILDKVKENSSYTYKELLSSKLTK